MLLISFIVNNNLNKKYFKQRLSNFEDHRVINFNKFISKQPSPISARFKAIPILNISKIIKVNQTMISRQARVIKPNGTVSHSSNINRTIIFIESAA